MSDDLVAVAAVDDVAPGSCQKVTVNGFDLVVFNLDGDFYVTSGTCPHKGAPMGLIGKDRPNREGGHGSINEDAGTISCPYHHWEFDLETGESVAGFRQRIRTLDVDVEDGQILVDL